MKINELKDIELGGIAKDFLQHLKECEYEQSKAFEHNKPIVSDLKLYQTCIIFAWFIFDIMLICVFSGLGANLILGTKILNMLLYCEIIFILLLLVIIKMLAKKMLVLHNSLKLNYPMVDLGKDDLKLLNSVLKNNKEKIGEFPILDIENKRYIQNGQHIEDITEFSTAKDKTISLYKFYNVSIGIQEDSFYFVSKFSKLNFSPQFYDDIKVAEMYEYSA